jgi:2-polyprenyl-3-methyl-5-hydroxy-6-metoxy-1,4-benzoquinol methylase
MLLALLASLTLTADLPPDDPAPLQGLDPAGMRMLAPSRERILQADALVDSLRLSGAERVADVGAGPGFFSLKLARHLPRGKVVATDLDPQALAVLQRRAQKAGLANIEARKVSPAAPGLEPGAYDLIFLCQVDHYLPDRAEFFRQLALALKPGGRLAIANYERYREPVRAAASAAGFVFGSEPLQTPGHFLLVFTRGPGT